MVRARPIDGGREMTVRAPIYELPMFVRAGAVLTLLPPDVDTLAGLAAADGGADAADRSAPHGPADAANGIVDAADRARERVVLAFPRGRAIRIGDGRLRNYRLQASVLKRPCSVRLDGNPVAYRWFRKRRVLHSQFQARIGKLVIDPCRPKE